MKSEKLDQFAKAQGIALERPGLEGHDVPISDDTKRRLLVALNADPAANPKCFLPDFYDAQRVWGISLQLYELRSARNWGIGDFADLAAMCTFAAGLGADFIGLTPLHAPFLADPGRCSPYEPSNRRFLNPLYIAVDQVHGFEPNRALEGKLRKPREAELVDYEGVAALKLAELRKIWKATRKGQPDEDLAGFERQGGEALRRHALFEAISAEMVGKGHGAGWQGWPEAFQDPDGAEVARFESRHQDDIAFHVWLQWLASRQLSEAAGAAARAGMRIGLYLDLAVGEALDGSATWSNREFYVRGATIGSPPDPFAVDGQDWRLAALQPATIAAGSGSPFRAMLESAMRHAGAIRIDHVAALRRLFLVPGDAPPSEGAYVAYPQGQMLQVLAELSQTYRCIVIGEDLGLFPDGLRSEMAAANVLSYRIMSYEKSKRGFIAPEKYPPLALACVSTHDHQTTAGWWRGADIDMREKFGLVPAEAAAEQRAERVQERKQIRRAFKAADIAFVGEKDVSPEAFVAQLVVGAHRYVARSSAFLVAARLADMTDEPNPTNVPGTSDAYPNWKPKLGVAIEELGAHELVTAVAEALAEDRPRR